jgi:predicted amidohydrolase YtcJ
MQKITAFDGKNFTAFSVVDGEFDKLSANSQKLLKQWDSNTLVIDAKGQRVIPGINDSHLHVVRGGRFLSKPTGDRFHPQQTTTAVASPSYQTGKLPIIFEVIY